MNLGHRTWSGPPLLPWSRAIYATQTAVHTTNVKTNAISVALPVGILNAVGRVIRWRAAMKASTTGSPTLLVNSALTDGIVSPDFGTPTTASPGASVTNVAVDVTGFGEVRTTGAQGTLSGNSVCVMNRVATQAGIPVDTITLNLAGNVSLLIPVTWSASSASNTCAVTTFLVEVFSCRAF